MADYAVLYSSATGFVLGAWSRTTSDNLSTFSSDGHLTIDGEKVVDNIGDRADLAGVLLTDPTDIDVAAPLGTQEVDSLTAPTDGGERTDSDRWGRYIYDLPVE